MGKSLEKECQYFHRFLFRRDPSAEIKAQYQRANLQFMKEECENNPLIEKIITHHLDLEAIEIALRRRNPNNILKKKLHILLFLVEVRASYFHHFYNIQDWHLRAFLTLSLSTLRSLYKILKGSYLIWRFQLV